VKSSQSRQRGPDEEVKLRRSSVLLVPKGLREVI